MKGSKIKKTKKEIFLSDLCGREVGWSACRVRLGFLSDLCGREAKIGTGTVFGTFLSDLCGREGK